MSANYKFIMNGEVLQDEPMGWDSAKIKIMRNEVYRGLFVEYIPDIIFHGDGYDILTQAFEDDGICASVNVLIQYREGDSQPLKLLFDGRIKVAEVKFNDEKCTAECSIEDKTLASLIQERGKTKVQFDAEKTIDGSAIGSGNILNNFYIYSHVLAAHFTRGGYLVKDAIQHTLNYITDNGLIFVSDYFENQTTSTQKTVIQFNGAALVQSSNSFGINIDLINYFGETHTYFVTCQSSALATLQLIARTLHPNNALVTGIEQFYNNDMRFFTRLEIVGTDTIELYHDLPFQVGISVAGTITTPVEISEGMKYSFIMNENQITGLNTKVPKLSFNDLWENLNKFKNLQCDLYTQGGNNYIRIEPVEYFMDGSTKSVSIDYVKDNQRIISNKFSKDLIMVESKNDKRFSAGEQAAVGNITREMEWVVQTKCLNNEQDCKANFIVDHAVIINALVTTATSNDDDIYLIEGDDSGVTNIAARSKLYYHKGYSDINGNYVEYFGINFHLTNYHTIKSWLPNIYGNPRFNNYEITNDREFNLIWENNFNRAMKFSELKDILENKNYPIGFSLTTPTYEKLGWIEQMEYDINKTQVNFKLISQ